MSGSSTVQPITQAVAEEFNALAPNVATTVDGPGTGDGFELFCGGQTDISDASRPISEEEIAACEASGIEFIELRVADRRDRRDDVRREHRRDLPVLRRPLLADRPGVDRDREAGATTTPWPRSSTASAGATNSPFPAAPLVITGPGEESGTFDSFVDIVFGDIAEERGQDDTTRPDYQASPNDNVIIEGIGGNPSSLGWVGFAFAEDAGDAVTELEIDGGDGCVAPTAETIADNSYPISRDLWVYVSATNLESNPALGPFIDYYLSPEGLANVAEVGYVDLAEDSVQATLDVWEAGTTGVEPERRVDATLDCGGMARDRPPHRCSGLPVALSARSTSWLTSRSHPAGR